MNKKELFKLFKDFFKFGSFTFGGGWSIVAQAEKQYCEEEKVISESDLMDIASLGKCFPGMMVCNFAMLFGFKRKGFWGGMACVAGMIIMPAVIIMILSKCYDALKNYEAVMAALTGIRAAIVPIIIYSVKALISEAFSTCYGVAIVAGILAMQVFFGVDYILLIAAGIICGLIIGEAKRRRGEKRGFD